MAATPVPEIIALKRDGKELSKEQIGTFLRGVVDETVQDSQLGAFLMATFLRGMSDKETVELTNAMTTSGEVLHWPAEWKAITVDKHSTGGVGDKISLPLVPALAACGLKVPMISGRGLGHTGGTLDKLESIPGFNVMQTSVEMTNIINDVGCFIVGQTATLVPADRIMYAHRDVTGTVSSIPLICGSIISKKAAETLGALILDVKVGKGAVMKSSQEAEDLARNLVNVSNGMGINTKAIMSRMDHPIGLAIGNALEVIESLQCLQGKGPKSLRTLVSTLGGHLLHSTHKCKSPEEGIEIISEVLSNGKALEKFRQMLKAQGVEENVANRLCSSDMTDLPKAKHTTDDIAIFIPIAGYVSDIDSYACAVICNKLGAGRTKAGEAVDHAVGMVLCVAYGDRIEKGMTWSCC
ncbi:hypothetical protein CAPTEDRAFT_177354 [Capitella teleta]|uniref:Thymidine phosphorylase n=1 Tax=Capitella teleta TaxID=283909 RepID=R7U0W3_CAPTE|nr:hypothetical protein CAPTEDRAFT_177354 [Capitella teleta]|eukprot:ELT96810.1 hypothetical protein CAPTEDRAFT_177354 [Capitella teleta]